MEPQDVVQKPPRAEPAKSTLPQPGKPVPSRAYPGALLVVEGTDGSGKSTQLYLLKRWLEIGGRQVARAGREPSPLREIRTPRGGQQPLLPPVAILHLKAAARTPPTLRYPQAPFPFLKKKQ